MRIWDFTRAIPLLYSWCRVSNIFCGALSHYIWTVGFSFCAVPLNLTFSSKLWESEISHLLFPRCIPGAVSHTSFEVLFLIIYGLMVYDFTQCHWIWDLPQITHSLDETWLLHKSKHDSFMQRTATHCNKLQHTATHCNTLHHTATHCNTLQHTAAHCSTLQHTATHCDTLQRTATHCNTLQHTATHYDPLQHTATHCHTL